MEHPVGDAKQWRKLAHDLRQYAKDVGNPDGRAELMQAAEDWERRAAEAESRSSSNAEVELVPTAAA